MEEDGSIICFEVTGDVDKTKEAPGPDTGLEAVRQLEAFLDAGGNLPDNVRARLIAKLQQPNPAPIVQTTTAVAAAATAVRPEVGAEYNTLPPEFQTPVAREEFESLSPADRLLISQAVKILKDNLLAFRAVAAKPIGTTREGYEDYSAFDVVSSQENISEISQRLSSSLGSLAKTAATDWTCNNIKIFQHPGNPDALVLQCNLWVPPGTIIGETRSNQSKHVLVLKNAAAIKELLLQPEALRLISFIIKTLGIQNCPVGFQAFFDGSFAGYDGKFHRGDNGMIAFDFSTQTIKLVPNTRAAQSTTKQGAEFQSASSLQELKR